MIPVVRKYTATKLPHGLKRPATKAVAPKNAAANAGSSRASPAAGSAAPLVPVIMTPAKAGASPTS